MTGVLASGGDRRAAEIRARGKSHGAAREPTSRSNWKRALVRPRAAALELRHLRAARGVARAVRPGAVHAPRQRRRAVAATRSSICRCSRSSVALMLPGPVAKPIGRGRGKPVFVAAVAVLFAGQAMLAFAGSSLALTLAALVVFFTAFNLARSHPPVARVQVCAARESRAPPSVSTRACSSSARSSAPPAADGCRNGTARPRSSDSASCSRRCGSRSSASMRAAARLQ